MYGLTPLFMFSQIASAPKSYHLSNTTAPTTIVNMNDELRLKIKLYAVLVRPIFPQLLFQIL